ncbi:CAMK family protein kinase [Tritrichomonas foetus]|uniref:CAMK family protein kinase n=1 Tax=Tritrichomonas foetus TaxID=1144522 RepID=A0A1J4KF24_9EUKA|nr:CAMK family protein kinase [Tritrichomonas foetus]|eukprot:OHT07981.1 CAMK family protein kinase [Tritrichomonas foetus]
MDETSPESEKLVCPRKIGPYILQDTIGQGAYATVKLAYSTITRQTYACKIIRQKRIKTDQQRENFIREIRILQQMRNPHIVSLFDLLKDSVNYYVILEYCPNGDLLSLCVEKTKMNEDEARIYLNEILLGLKYIHSNNVGHRDLKPENILIDENGHAKISDFGLSKILPSEKNNLTRTACGSPCYTAPEIISAVPYDPRIADMWSVGVILYAMVTGQLPWTKRNKIQLFKQIREAQYTIPSNLSPQLRDLLTNLMNKQPSLRYSVEDALKSEFMMMKPSFVEIKENHDSLPYVSLRKLDRFFELDEDDVVNFDADSEQKKLHCCSFSNIKNFNFQKTSNILASKKNDKISSLSSRSKKNRKIENCVSNYNKAISTYTIPEITSKDIKSIMKRIKKSKIVRPISTACNHKLKI